MNGVEPRRQVFRTPEQWGHGLASKLRRVEGGGLELFSRPAFSGWVDRSAAARDAASIAADSCGRLFWIHPRRCRLYRRDPINGLVEAMLPLPNCVARKGHRFGRILATGGRLWIVDRDGSRVLGVRADTFQIIAEIVLDSAVDIAAAGGRLFALDRRGIHEYDMAARWISTADVQGVLQCPVALAADPSGVWLYVLDERARGFLRFTAGGTFDMLLGNFDDVVVASGAPLVPRFLVVDKESLLVSDGSATAHEFSSDGGYIGDTGDVHPLSAILGMGVAPDGALYFLSPEGIASFSRQTGAAGGAGTFYTRTLDNGAAGRKQWHRLDLVADLDAAGSLEVFYASSPEPGLASAVDGIFARDTTVAAKGRALESVLGDLWNGPHELRAGTTALAPPSAFRAGASHSVFFSADMSRYLWIKLVLAGLAPRARVSVREMRIYYPRLSYLRYLPAVYQKDPVSQEFLERYLSLFETVLGGLEATIQRIPDVFDPVSAPDEFLDWLAGWLDLGLEEYWPSPVKRRLIASASRLYRQKGTPAGLAAFLEVLTGRPAMIRESFDVERPFVLGDRTYLGRTTRVSQRPLVAAPRGETTIVGHSSVLGTSRLRASTHVGIDPFRKAAHRFSVLLELTPRDYRRLARGVHRIIRENAPAHVAYDIRLVSGAALGSASRLGVNVRVEDVPPFCLGSSRLGEAVCIRPVSYAPELGIDATLAGPLDGPPGASAAAYGE